MLLRPLPATGFTKTSQPGSSFVPLGWATKVPLPLPGSYKSPQTISRTGSGKLIRVVIPSAVRILPIESGPSDIEVIGDWPRAMGTDADAKYKTRTQIGLKAFKLASSRLTDELRGASCLEEAFLDTHCCKTPQRESRLK